MSSKESSQEGAGRCSARLRLVGATFVAYATLVVGAAACSDESTKVSCVVKVGGAQTTVSLDSKVGASSVATIGSYSVTFSVLDGLKLEAEVHDADSWLMTSTAGGTTGGGSAGTPDGRLEYSCAP